MSIHLGSLHAFPVNDTPNGQPPRSPSNQNMLAGASTKRTGPQR